MINNKIALMVTLIVLTLIILTIGVGGVVVTLQSELVGRDQTNDPYRWEGGTIGVTGDCEVFIWDENEEWFASLPGNYQGSGTDSDPFKLFEATRGLSCDPQTGKVSIRYWDATKNSWGDTPPPEVPPPRSATPLSEDGPVYIPSPPSLAIQSSCLACQQIDEVWEKVRVALNIAQAGLTRPVWNPETQAWTEYATMYAPPVPQRVQPRTTGAATLDLVKEIKAVNVQTTEEQCFDSNYGSGDRVPLERVTVAGRTIDVNKAMAIPLRNVARVIEQYGYQIKAQKDIGSCRGKGEKAATCGNFHRACLAIDINPPQNPHCPKVANWADWWGYVPTTEERERCRRGEIITNIPPEIVKAFEENGFYWGGRYGQQYGQPTPDPMHFEFVDGSAKCCERTYAPLSYNYAAERPAVAAASAIPGVAREDQFDQHVSQATQKFGVDAALIKALIQKESGFNPNAPHGGLMQVNNFGEHYTAVARAYPELSLSNNVADPRTNIFVGAYVFDQTRKSLRGCTELGCQIAAYNTGPAVINAAAAGVSAPPTWDKVQSVLNIGHFKRFPPYNSWEDEKVQNRVNLVKNYVRTVLEYREQYTSLV